MNIVFCGNDTGMEGDTLIPGGQTERYLESVWRSLEEAGVDYEVKRQPVSGALNIYTNNRDRYFSRSQTYDGFSIHVSHGLASKGYRDHFKTRTYRHIFVPGGHHRDEVLRSGAPARKLEVLGYPKLDELFSRRAGEYSRDPSRIRVLFAPTHGGGGESFVEGNSNAPGARATAYWRKEEVLQSLQEAGFEVVESLHPRHAPRHKATWEEYITTDVVVADGGSTLYEAGVLGIPVVSPTWMVGERNIERGGRNLRTLESVYYTKRYGYHVDNPDALSDTILEAVENGQDERTRDWMEGVVPSSLRGSSGERWAQRIMEIAGGVGV